MGFALDWITLSIGTISLGVFSYSGFLWWLIGEQADQPNEFALEAANQERWMAAGLLGMGLAGAVWVVCLA